MNKLNLGNCKNEKQFDLFSYNLEDENTDYLTKQIITYIGNKRSILPHIGSAVEFVKQRLGKKRLVCFDLFSGSGIVSRFLKKHSSLIISNDFERYCEIISNCYLKNKSEVNMEEIRSIVNDFNSRVMEESFAMGFIEELYAPKNDKAITKDDRVFYTKENARRIDNYRRLIESAPEHTKDLLLAPLLSKASIHANTAGVFKGFYKNRHTGIGQFGGSGADALKRIMGKITLEEPVLSNYECDYAVYKEDANKLVTKLNNIDVTYIDPPYNQHPYGSNYFMLNLISEYRRPKNISKVSGIPKDWQRSGYNKRAHAFNLFKNIIEALDSKYIIISYNDEGFITPYQMMNFLKNHGKIITFEIPYTAFRGSRNFTNRSIRVLETIYLLERD